MSGTYVRDISVTLHRMFRDAVKGATPTPARTSTPSRRPHRHGAAHPPPVEGIRALVDSLDPRKPMEFALRAAVGSGMRRGEIVGLDVRDIDFEAGEIHVVHGTDSLGRQKDTKTAASKRALPIAREPQGGLEGAHCRHRGDVRGDAEGDGHCPWPVLGDDTPLMCNELGERMRPHSVTRWWGVTGTATAARA
ncbi:MAG: hypothetical protein ACLTDR_00580 [Adlercreutzia equolifaciens]